MAQTQFGAITGRVADTTGALISQAQVTLTNTANEVKRETTTNPDGTFIFVNVGPGNYEISVENQGFNKNVKNIRVEVAQRINLDFLMQVGGVQNATATSDESRPLDMVTGAVSRIVTEREIIQLPLITRNPYDLVGLTPPATPEW
jgi:hypothetical protein